MGLCFKKKCNCHSGAVALQRSALFDKDDCLGIVMTLVIGKTTSRISNGNDCWAIARLNPIRDGVALLGMSLSGKVIMSVKISLLSCSPH